MERGSVFAGIKGLDENKELQFEELFLKLAEQLKCRSEDPYVATNEVLRDRCRSPTLESP